MHDEINMGFGIGSTFVAVMLALFWHFLSYGADLRECEKDLPRSQECRLIAVPVEGKS